MGKRFAEGQLYYCFMEGYFDSHRNGIYAIMSIMMSEGNNENNTIANDARCFYMYFRCMYSDACYPP